MKQFLVGFGRKAMNGIIPGLFFTLTVASITYALTYNWSDPSGIRGRVAGNPLTSTGWNLLVGNMDNLNERLTNAEGNGGIVPTGAIMAFNLASCPTGWTLADGVSGRPDLRGEFIRGLDNGRGVDSGRTLGSWQASQNLAHSHSITDPGHSHSYYVYSVAGGTGPHSDNYSYQGNPGSFSTSVSYTNITINSSGGNESRPRNVALLYCVKN